MNYPQEKIKPYSNDGKKSEQVEQMFDNIAPAYDQLNHTLSLGIDRSWRRKAINWLKPFRPQQIMDVATGTGDFAILACHELQPEQLIGTDISEGMMNVGRERVKKEGIKDPSEITSLLKEIIADMLRGGEELDLATSPSIILVIGVNGVGKTTTIGKLANALSKEGKKVILAAADTFRAAAIEQLEIWADRSKCEIIKQKEGSDPAAVIYDAISAAKARHADVIICDTAGRLHNKKHLMDELAKINRVIDRELPDASKEKLLVLDATTGQNAVNQAEQFRQATGITGIVLTKLDGTAKGGVVLAIKDGLGIPVKYIGVGEQIDDLQPFNPDAFADALFSIKE